VQLPGEREWRLSEERRRDGLPMSPTTLEALDAVASEIGATSRFAAMG
jgi:LDH2 family malate/lactate/ureidoglycolate dehydrogenase